MIRASDDPFKTSNNLLIRDSAVLYFLKYVRNFAALNKAIALFGKLSKCVKK